MALDFHMPSNLVLLLIPKTTLSSQRLEDPQGWWLKSYITDFKKPYLDIKYFIMLCCKYISIELSPYLVSVSLRHHQLQELLEHQLADLYRYPPTPYTIPHHSGPHRLSVGMHVLSIIIQYIYIIWFC